MTPVCQKCGGPVTHGRVSCDECMRELGKIVGAVARVSTRFELGAPVEAAELELIEEALSEALRPRRLVGRVVHRWDPKHRLELVDLEAFEPGTWRRRWATLMIVKGGGPSTTERPILEFSVDTKAERAHAQGVLAQFPQGSKIISFLCCK